MSIKAGPLTTEVEAKSFNTTDGTTLEWDIPLGKYKSIQFRGSLKQVGTPGTGTFNKLASKLVIGKLSKPVIELEAGEITTLVELLTPDVQTGHAKNIDTAPTSDTDQAISFVFEAPAGMCFEMPADALFQLQIGAAAGVFTATTSLSGRFSVLLEETDNDDVVPIYIHREKRATASTQHEMSVGEDILRSVYIQGTVAGRIKDVSMRAPDGSKAMSFGEVEALADNWGAYHSTDDPGAVYFINKANIPYFDGRKLKVNYTTADTLLAFFINMRL